MEKGESELDLMCVATLLILHFLSWPESSTIAHRSSCDLLVGERLGEIPREQIQHPSFIPPGMPSLFSATLMPLFAP
jgi:hypothetical protein